MNFTAKLTLTILLSLAFPLGATLAADVPDELTDVSVEAVSYTSGDITDYTITFTIDGGAYEQPNLTFLNELAKPANGGSASYIDFNNSDEASVSFFDGLDDFLTLNSLEQRHVHFYVDADIPEGTYTFTINNAKNNLSPGGYGIYHVLAGSLVNPDDDNTFITSNEITIKNSDFGDGNRLDKPTVKKIKKRRATVNWENSAYISSATKLKLELRKRNGKLIKRFKKISSSKVNKVLTKKHLEAGKKYKVRMKAVYPTGDVTKWSKYKKFKTKSKN